MERGRKALVEEHLPLVQRIASFLSTKTGGRVSPEELESYGVEGLMEAVARYHPEQGSTFRTYAYYRIRGAMIDGLRTSRSLPSRVKETMAFYQASDHVLEAQSERPAPADAAEATRVLGLSIGALVAGFVMMSAFPSGELPDKNGLSAEDRMLHEEQRGLLDQGMARLSMNQRRILDLYYREGETMGDIGRIMGMHKTSVSRLHARALAALRNFIATAHAVDPPDAEVQARTG